jgi:hypothetical protein
VAASRRELILWVDFANPREDQASLFGPDELHAAEPNPGVAPGIVGEDNLIGRQRYSEAVRKEVPGGPFPAIGNIETRFCSRRIDVGAANSMSSGMSRKLALRSSPAVLV